MKLNGCEFADSFEFDDIDFDTVNECLVSSFISRPWIPGYFSDMSAITNYFRILIKLQKHSSTGALRSHQIAIKLTKEKNFNGTKEIIKRLIRSWQELKIVLAAEKRAAFSKQNVNLLFSHIVITVN